MADPRPFARTTLVVMLALCVTLAACSDKSDKPGITPGRTAAGTASKADANMNVPPQLLDALYGFKLLGVMDYKQALAAYAVPEASRKLEAMNSALWPAGSPASGWSYFLNTCLVVPADKGKAETVVGFYHPWSDVFLVTHWGPDRTGKLMIQDFEVLMGDFIRQDGQPPFVPEQSYLRGDLYRPVSIGISTARTIDKFSETFKGAAGKRGGWRKALDNLANHEAMEASHYGAGWMLASNMGGLGELIAPDKRSAGEAVKEETFRILEAGKDGKARRTLKTATETPAHSMDAVLTLKPEEWARMYLTAFMADAKNSLVILASADNPDLFMSMSFSLNRGKARLERIDVLSFQAFYDNLDSLPREVAK